MNCFVAAFISLLFCLFVAALGAIGRIGKPKIDPVKLIEAIGIVETGKDDNAIGVGEAVGRFQLTKEYVDKINKIMIKNGEKPVASYDDRYDPEKSKLMIGIYWSYYARQPFIGFHQIEDYISIHKAGPKGHKKMKHDKELEVYVEKVKKQYEELLKT